jgi:uncharacterized OB-fold protein
MITKCPNCGAEYSYGRIICHICDNSIIFFGAMFEKKRKNYHWNCDTVKKKNPETNIPIIAIVSGIASAPQ